jgi:hypothetical protein
MKRIHSAPNTDVLSYHHVIRPFHPSSIHRRKIYSTQNSSEVITTIFILFPKEAMDTIYEKENENHGKSVKFSNFPLLQ